MIRRNRLPARQLGGVPMVPRGGVYPQFVQCITLRPRGRGAAVGRGQCRSAGWIRGGVSDRFSTRQVGAHAGRRADLGPRSPCRAPPGRLWTTSLLDRRDANAPPPVLEHRRFSSVESRWKNVQRTFSTASPGRWFPGTRPRRRVAASARRTGFPPACRGSAGESFMSAALRPATACPGVAAPPAPMRSSPRAGRAPSAIRSGAGHSRARPGVRRSRRRADPPRDRR